jgi:hypothetical protein
MKREKDDNQRKPMHLKRIIPLLLVVLLIIVLCCILKQLIGKKHSVETISSEVEQFVDEKIIGTEGEVTTITESEILGVFQISELQTSDYIYNGIKAVYDDSGRNIKYYVAYEGKITAGIDFNDIKIEINNDTKEINITVPNAKIQNYDVDAGNLEYIFTDDKYNDDNILQEAYDKCLMDLKSKANSEDKIIEQAKANAINVVEALVSPWVEQVDSEYKVTVQ